MERRGCQLRERPCRSEGSVRTTTVARFRVLRLEETVDAHVVRVLRQIFCQVVALPTG